MPPSVLWLSSSESIRLASLRNPERRAHYLAGHWLIRELLTAALGRRPSDWKLQERRSQAPCAINAPQPTWLSISHSGEWIAAAVADVEIGIDIEQKPRQLDSSIESLLLNADESIGTLTNDDLLRRWVAKEAWLKSRGGGALPERLKQLMLHDTPIDEAPIRTISDGHLCVALAITPHAAVNLHGQRLFWDTRGLLARPSLMPATLLASKIASTCLNPALTNFRSRRISDSPHGMDDQTARLASESKRKL